MHACQLTVNAVNLNGAKNFSRNSLKLDSILKLGYDVNIFIDTRFKSYQRKALAKLYPEYTFTSCNPRFNSRGIAIFVNAYLDFVFIDCETDDQGNLLALRCLIYGREMTIIGFYGPSTDSEFFYQRFSDFTRAAYHKCPNLIVMGDFNIFFDKNKDSFGYPALPKPRGRNIINQMATETNLIDSFRYLYPNTFKVSWRKWNGLKASRLDHCFLSQGMAEYLSEVDYLPPPLVTLDHCLCVATLTFSNLPRSTSIFKVPSGLEQDPQYCKALVREIIASITNNYQFDPDTSHILQRLNDDVEIPDLTSVASSFKAEAWRARPGSVLQEVINSAKDIARRHVKSINKEHQRELNTLITQLKEAYDKMIQNDSQVTYEDFYDLQCQYKDKVESFSQRRANSNSKNRGTFGEKPTRFLFNSRCDRKQRKPIIKIQLADGTTVDTKEGVHDALVNFWSGLYNSEVSQSLSVSEFLGTHLNDLPKLSEEQRIRLDREISEPEVKAAVFSLRNGAASGFDGVGATWFKKFYNLLAPVLLATYQEAFSNEYVPEFFKYAMICLLPKSNNRTSVSNWRPISLLPTSYKILSTIAARRLKPVLPDLIGPDQKAYVPRRLLYDIHYNLFNEINLAKKLGRSGNLIAIDYRKAFDSVHFSAIIQTLRAFGFGPSFISLAVMTLHGRAASLIINGELTTRFALGNGVPQGDAVAPYLFILLMEILLFRTRADETLIALNHGSPIKVLSFADDLTLLLGGGLGMVKIAIDLIKTFTEVSGLAINLNKTQLLPIHHDGYSDDQLDGITQVSQIKLLGIFFDSTFNPTQKNSDVKFNQLRGQAFKWSSAHLNIDGRLIIAKSIMLPIFHNLGILPGIKHDKVAWEVDKRVNLYLWSGNHKVRTIDTRLPKEFGGLGCTNSAEMWLSFRIKALFRVFDSSEKWAIDVASDLERLMIVTLDQLKRVGILELKVIAANLTNDLAKHLITDLADFQIRYFKNNPELILNEKVFYNFWGSIQPMTRLQANPSLANNKFNLYSGLKADLLTNVDSDLSYFEFLDAFYSGRLNLVGRQISYVAQFVRRISKIIPMTALATYKISNRFSLGLRSTNKLRQFLSIKNYQFDFKNFVYKRWDRRTGLFTPSLAQLMISNHQLKIEDSRISDFKIRLNCCILGFRKTVSKFRAVDPRCFLCDLPDAKHDLLHTLFDCQFARRSRSLMQNHLFFPLEYNLNIITPEDYFIGISADRAEQLGLSRDFVNSALLLIKYNTWICSLGDSENLCIQKAYNMNKTSISKLVRTKRL